MRTTEVPARSRRDFLKVLAGCTTTLGLSMLPCPDMVNGQTAQGRPNVLTIVSDDLNGWIGCLGRHPQVKTPNIDRLAQRGSLFTNSHAAAPLCNPSRLSFFTGIRPSTSGIYWNEQPLRAYFPNAVTMPQHFMANGYRVMGGGKVFHTPDPASWHEYFPSLSWHRPPAPSPSHPPLNGIPDLGDSSDWGAIDVADEEMEDGKTARWAAEVLGRSHDKPFFLAVGMQHPHPPLYAPAKYFNAYPPETISLPEIREDDLDDLPPRGVSFATTSTYRTIMANGQLPQAVAAYLACISFVDAQIGVILDALDQSRYASNTVVVLWSDHGRQAGEKFHWGKSALWEKSTYAPLIISAPGVTTGGGRCNKPVSLIDVYPALVEICGLPSPVGLEGASLKPLLEDPNATWNHAAITTCQRNNHAVRSERYRYIHYSDGGEELYDHENDSDEHYNLAGMPEYAQVKQELASWLPRVNAP